MNKRNLLRILTAVASTAGAISALDLIGVVNLFPENVAGWILAGNASVLAVKEIAMVAGDYLDDGKRNNSFEV